jgi:translation initiation factor 2B subunit (eIF-2B alpha/beta/delta family)
MVYRNRSIADSGKFWCSTFIVMVGFSLAFFMTYVNASDIAYVIVFIPTAIAGFVMCFINLKHIRGSWSEVRNDEEIKEQINETKKETIDYVQTALEELPQSNFSEKFKNDIINHLTNN